MELTPADWNVLLLRCRHKDGRAWARLVEILQKRVYWAIRRTGLAESEVEDVFQTTFVALHRGIDSITNGAGLPSWVITTATRCAIERKLQLLKRSSEVLDPDDNTLLSQEKSAETVVEETAQSLTLHRAMASLTGRCAKLLEALFGAKEASYEEASRMLAIPLGSIGPTKARCIEKLRSKLAELNFFA
ncbi:MAG: sigma-70 family RNA polymerase sigma factor [Armatimonadetes bacterium]|nr:sigma-70 family RNA polymerase sigma factor [Armatimonadota bacterium]